MHEIRWNPLVKKWIIVAAHRATRPWRPDEKSREFTCPFCPGAPELKNLDEWDVVVLPNKYPALIPEPQPVEKEEMNILDKKEARGVTEVIVETPEHEGDLCTLTLDHAKRVVETYRNEVDKLAKERFIEYVAVFRNKGKEIGVSLTHPHSQIYALPFIPPRIMAEINAIEEYKKIHGSCMICDIVKYEIESKKRIIYSNEEFIALIPYYAMWPFEIHVYPIKHVKTIRDLNDHQLTSLADVLRVVTATYNSLLERDAPYIMAFHDHPVKGNYEYHFHVEFYQPYRDKEKLKYAAGIEWGFWVFTYDGVPEQRAVELREACRKAVKTLNNVLGGCM
ncbi:MAG: galactose-1-phosphate uridylyltransferase [Desulfurococcaceae archaeon]